MDTEYDQLCRMKSRFGWVSVISGFFFALYLVVKTLLSIPTIHGWGAIGIVVLVGVNSVSFALWVLLWWTGWMFKKEMQQFPALYHYRQRRGTTNTLFAISFYSLLTLVYILGKHEGVIVLTDSVRQSIFVLWLVGCIALGISFLYFAQKEP